MKEFKVTVESESGSISYEILKKTSRGAKGFGEKVAKEAFYGEKVEIFIEEIVRS